jgi:S1-C subfamily serine protease
VEVADVTQQQAQTLHLDGAAGAEIVLLDHDAPAGKAGLHVHDVILASNGTKIRNAEQFRELLRQESSGKKLRLSVNRDGAVRAISVQLEDRRKVEQEAQQEIAQSDLPPGAQGFLSGGNVPSMAGGFHFWGLGSSFHVGALVEPMTPEMLDYLGLRTGVMVKSVARHSAADHAGLKPHDVILQVGSETVATTSDWERLLRASNGKVVTVAIQRENTRQTLWLQLNGKRH